jgi:hypothetical protein
MKQQMRSTMKNKITEDDLISADHWKSMDFNSSSSLTKYGFEGPVKICSWDSLENPLSLDEAGIYLIARTEKSPVVFLKSSKGGVWKSKTPTVSADELKRKWVPETCVLYIGKAGGSKQKKTLSKRLGEYMDFGKGKSKPHWGGRYIWQLGDCSELEIYWLKLCSHEPAQVERALIDAFYEKYEQLPFANLRR